MNKEPFRILHLDQDDSTIRRVHEILHLTSSNCFIEVVKTLTDFQYALPGRKFDLILVDYSFARENEWHALALARQWSPYTPFILLADRMTPELLAEASQQGAWDYVLRTNLPVLPFIVCRARESRLHAMDYHAQFQADLLNLSGEAILVRNAEGMIVFWNEGARHIYGWDQVEAYGRDIRALLPSAPGSSSWEQITEECARTGKWEGEMVRRARNGEEVVVSSRWTARWDENGGLREIVEIDRKESTKHEEAAGPSPDMARTLHELNNMLAAIGNATDLLKTCGTDGNDGALFQILETSSKRAANLARKIAHPSVSAVAPHGVAAPKADAMYPDQNLRGNGELVLVVDDEDSVGELFRTFLTHNGYNVEVARDGEEAMYFFRQNYQQVDLVVCDLGLPTMQGRDVIEQMRMIKPRLKLIISTGDGGNVAGPLSGETCLTKPYDIDSALRAVRAKLNESSRYVTKTSDAPLVLKLAI